MLMFVETLVYLVSATVSDQVAGSGKKSKHHCNMERLWEEVWWYNNDLCAFQAAIILSISGRGWVARGFLSWNEGDEDDWSESYY